MMDSSIFVAVKFWRVPRRHSVMESAWRFNADPAGHGFFSDFFYRFYQEMQPNP